MTHLLLLRHAESEWNAQGRWQGLADSPLSDLGEGQAGRAGQTLAGLGRGFTAVVASDLQRARRTAELMAPALGLTGPVMLEPGLREYDVGQWSGLTRPQIEARWPGALDDWRHGRLFATPGGETRDAFDARITATLSRLGANHAGTVLVITHGGVIHGLERALGTESRRVPHLTGRWLEATADGLRAHETVALTHDGDGPPTRRLRPAPNAEGEANHFPGGPVSLVSDREEP